MQIKLQWRRKSLCKDVLEAKDENVKIYRKFREKKREELRGVYISEKKELNEQFGRMMNQDVSGNRKFFNEEEDNVNNGKVQNCNRIKNITRSLMMGEDDVRKG